MVSGRWVGGRLVGGFNKNPRCVTIKDSKSVKINSGNPLYLIYSKVNGYFEEINKSKHLTLVPSNRANKKLKHGELWSEIKDLIRESVTKSSDHYDEKYMKVEFNVDYELLLNKTIEIDNSYKSHFLWK